MNAKDTAAVTLSIGSVERETGLPKDTLRVWERRYGFPMPVRDASGERAYPLEQVERLRLLKRLLDRGHRPGKVVELALEGLQQLAGEADKSGAGPASEMVAQQDVRELLALCVASRFDELRHRLSQGLMRLGLAHFVMDVVAPLNVLVGMGWARGELTVYEEHLYTESVQIVLRTAIAGMPVHQSAPMQRPRVLLTTFPQEAHGLGLLMAEAIFTLEGAHCISLGVQTPIIDITRAVAAQSADIVALSFSAAARGNHVREGMRDLRTHLAPGIEIWAGGSCAALYRRTPPGLRVMDLPKIGSALVEWRREHPV